MSTEQIGEEDVREFARKLHLWGKDLPPKERALLEILLQSGAGSEETGDAEGFGSGRTIYGASYGVLSPLAKGSALSLQQGTTNGQPWYELQGPGQRQVKFGPYFDSAWHAI